MRWSFSHLEAPENADERAIKRAYAAKLRTTRPDEDPEGFQQLHEAYQQALAWVRMRETSTENHLDVADNASLDVEHTISKVADLLPELHSQLESLESKISNAEALLSRREPADATDEVESADASVRADEGDEFDFDAFLKHCTTLAEYSRDGELLNWLNAQPILWSLQHKAQIGHWLLHHLYAQRPPVPTIRFDVLANFFGLNDLHSGYDSYHIHMLRHRLQLAWEVKTHQLRLLAERTGREGSSLASAVRQTDRILKQLVRPFRLPQALFAGLMPLFPSAARRFLYRLDHGRLDDLPEPIDAEQVAFWDAATDHLHLAKPRLLLGATRCVAYALICSMLATLADLLGADAVSLLATFTNFAMLFSAMLTGWLALIGAQTCRDWLNLPEAETVRWPRLRLLLIPALVVVSIVLNWPLHLNTPSLMLGSATLSLAWQRFHARNSGLFGYEPRSPRLFMFGMSLLFITMIFTLADTPMLLTAIIAVCAAALWGLDLHKQRHNVHN